MHVLFEGDEGTKENLCRMALRLRRSVFQPFLSCGTSGALIRGNYLFRMHRKSTSSSSSTENALELFIKNNTGLKFFDFFSPKILHLKIIDMSKTPCSTNINTIFREHS